MRKALYIMGILSDHDIEWLLSHGQTYFTKTGSIVIREGEPINSLFILLDGKLSVRTSSVQGQEIACLYPGEILGEISYIDHRPPSASVVAVQDSQLFIVQSELLWNKLKQDNGFAARFYRSLATLLADRLRTTSSRLGYGKWVNEEDELDEVILDNSSIAARRFDDVLKRLRIN